jgi:hypothetical protein
MIVAVSEIVDVNMTKTVTVTETVTVNNTVTVTVDANIDVTATLSGVCDCEYYSLYYTDVTVAVKMMEGDRHQQRPDHAPLWRIIYTPFEHLHSVLILCTYDGIDRDSLQAKYVTCMHACLYVCMYEGIGKPSK